MLLKPPQSSLGEVPVNPDKVILSPDDKHNRSLVENAHPQTWENPDPIGVYNLVVLGGGTAGLVAAAGAALLGARVALIERHLMGGDCLNTGCVPSKALIHAARVIAGVRDAPKVGVVLSSDPSINFSKVMERVRLLRAQISKADSAQRFSAMGIDVYFGHARFTSRKSIEVAGKTLSFARAVIATGGRPIVPTIPGLEEIGYLTSETLFCLSKLPKRMAVVGAGSFGCEMAQAFARFGSDVILLELADRILPKAPHHVSELVETALEHDGVTIKKKCDIHSAVRKEGGRAFAISSAGQKEEIVVDEILLGVGRTPNVEDLGLSEAGVGINPTKGISVNGFLRTNNRRIYAAGDVCSPYHYTHTAEAQAAIVVQNALFLPSKKAGSLIVPWCTYTDPEVAHIGLYPEEAESAGIPVRRLRIEISEVDRAILDGESEGFAEAYLGRRGKILGATIVARRAGDLIAEIALAMKSEVGLETIASTIHPYPTQMEAIRKLGLRYRLGRVTPFIKRLFSLWLRLRRI